MTDMRDQLALLPDYLGAHITLSLSALAAGAALTTLLTLVALRSPRACSVFLTAASVIQTVPSLALLALMVPILGRIGFLPAWIALTAYSVLPMLRNAIIGLTTVDPAITEAARGVGMTDRQTLTMVQLPLAAPVIIAGIRTSAVWVVGIATLATPVGATSLGNYIFSGLQTQRFNVVLLGCVAAALLALVMDGLIRLIEIAASRRSRPLALVGALGLVTLVVGGLAPRAIRGIQSGGGPRIILGAKSFTEQYILTELIAIRLAEEGLDSRVLSNLGSTIVFDALVNGRVDIYVDYTGTIWANHMKRDRARPATETRAKVAHWLLDTHGVTLVGALGFDNTYALAMKRERADQLNIKTISDLAVHAPDMTIGGDYEFFSRPEWLALVRAYGLSFKNQRGLGSTLMYPAVNQGEVDVIGAFSTDGRIASFGLVILDDTRDAFPPYEAVMLLAPSANRRPRLVRILAQLAGVITDDMMREANRLVDLDKQSPRDAARWLDEQIGARAPDTITP